MEERFKKGKTNFIGIEFTDVEGNKKLVKPCKEVKKEAEAYLDKLIGLEPLK